MPISTIDQKGLTNPLTSVAANTVTSAAATALTLQSAGTTAVTIDTSQNVGIGTTSPDYNLQVEGSGDRAIAITSTTSGDCRLWLGDTAAPFNGAVIYRNDSDSLAFNTVATERMRIDSSGNVGIGTTSPSSYFSGGTNLVVGNASGNTGMTISSGSSSLGRILFADGTSGAEAYQGWVYYTHTDNAMTFATSASERMRITSSGALLVGKNTSSFSTAGFQVDNDGSLLVTKTQNDSGGAQLYLNRLNVNGAAVLFYKDTTNVGNISVTASATAYNTSSDYRLKENIAPMTGALAKVTQLKPVTYTWKADGSSGQGFIAHELQAVVPDCVTGEKDAVENYTDDEGNEQTRIKPQSVDTSFLVATLTAAIQELKAEFDAYKASHP
jgi:hypothetical protein